MTSSVARSQWQVVIETEKGGNVRRKFASFFSPCYIPRPTHISNEWSRIMKSWLLAKVVCKSWLCGYKGKNINSQWRSSQPCILMWLRGKF